jgi:DNA-binding transcriptional MerR regulator
MVSPARAGDLPPIPDKLFFKIGEVSRLVGVKPHVLRFWETEFAHVRPTKSGTGHRVYARADVERLRQIRVLLHERKFTIAGVRSLMARGGEAVEAAIALRPTEMALEADALGRRIEALERDLEAARGEAEALRREVAAAREEAAFWRAQARAVPPTLVARLRGQVEALRSCAEETIDG